MIDLVIYHENDYAKAGMGELVELWRIPFGLALSGDDGATLAGRVSKWVDDARMTSPDFRGSYHRVLCGVGVDCDGKGGQVNFVIANLWLAQLRGIEHAEHVASSKVKEAVEDLANALAEEFADAS